MITRIDPTEYVNAATVQIESDASDPWLALDEVEAWAGANGFVRTSEYQLRLVLVGGTRRFRGICYRITDEERAATDDAHRKMVDRGDTLMGMSVATTGETGR